MLNGKVAEYTGPKKLPIRRFADDPISSGIFSCDKQVRFRNRTSFRIIQLKRSTSPIYHKPLSWLVMNMHGKVVMVDKITIPLTKLGIHEI